MPRDATEAPVDRPEITVVLKSFIQTEFPNQGVDLDESTDLLEEWFVDSLGIIETAFFMESTFGIRVSRADVNGENFATLATLTEFVASRLSS